MTIFACEINSEHRFNEAQMIDFWGHETKTCPICGGGIKKIVGRGLFIEWRKTGAS